MKRLITAFLFLAAALFVFTPVKTNAATYTIQAADNFFNPTSQNANVGDTIIFQWIGPVRNHTATSLSVPGGAAPFNSSLNSGSTTFIYPLTQEGLYTYECVFHAPGMSGEIIVAAGGPATYSWNRTDSADFQTASNWTPDRTTPAVDDILVFNNGAANTIAYNVPTQTIGRFLLQSLTTLKLYNTFGGTVNTITISGGANPSLEVEAGSSLTFSATAATNGLVMNLATGATGTVNGNFTMLSNSGAASHRLQAIDASAVTFGSGSVFTFGPLVAGNSFGVGTGVSGLNSIIFANGSRYIFKIGSNPFGASAPSTVLIFQTGSTYEHNSSNAPSFSNRSYANIIYNTPSTISAIGAGTFTLENLDVLDGILNVNLTGRINLKGNISVASGKTLTFTPATSDSLFLNGTTQQTISGAGTLTFASGSRVITNNAAGILLTRDVSFLGELNMKAGNIVSDNLFLDPIRTVTIGTSPASAGSLVRTGGMIIAWVKRFLPASISGTPVLFPTGFDNSGTIYYKPLTINFTSAPTTGGSLTVKVTYPILPISQDPPEGGRPITPLDDGGFPVNKVGMMHWEALVSGITDGTYDISIDANGQSGITDPTLLRVVYQPDIVSEFSLVGTHAAGSGTVANRTGISGNTFGNFYAGGNTTNNPLPVELDNFVATTIKNEVILDWFTGHEQNNTGFEVQRAVLSDNNITSVDFVSTANFETVGYVKGKGNSNLQQVYKYNDKNLQAGRYAYRLKQIDVNGNFTYHLLSSEVFVNLPGKFTISQNYPNPFNPVTNINFEIPFDGIVKIIVYDNIGREVKALVNGNVNAGYHKVEFNAAGLPSGIYFYRVNVSSGTQKFDKVFKMMLIK